MASDAVLQAFDLSKRFKHRWAVSGLNLTVPRGEVFGFLGPNGAGKSTTIRMFLSLISPTSGRVELFGKPLHRHRAEVLARVGGLVERADFYLYLTARRNLGIVHRVEVLARRKQCTPAQLALAWVLAQGEDIVPIPGTKRRNYLEENVAALAVNLTPADLAELDAAAPRGVAAGQRYPEFAMQAVNR